VLPAALHSLWAVFTMSDYLMLAIHCLSRGSYGRKYLGYRSRKICVENIYSSHWQELRL